MDITSEHTQSKYRHALNALPDNIFTEREVKIPGETLLQIIEVVSCQKSKYEILQSLRDQINTELRGARRQVEEAQEDEAENTQSTANDASTKQFFQLIVRDYKGNACFATELKKVPAISANTPLGTLLIINDIVTSRGVILLKESNTNVLEEPGVAEWEAEKRQHFIDRLEEQLEAESQGGRERRRG